MTQKVKRISTASSENSPCTLLAYRVNWTFRVAVTEEAIRDSNIDLESMYAWEAWNQFLDRAGVRDIELDIIHLELTLSHLPPEDRDWVLNARSQLKEVFAKFARMRDVDDNDSGMKEKP